MRKLVLSTSAALCLICSTALCLICLEVAARAQTAPPTEELQPRAAHAPLPGGAGEVQAAAPGHDFVSKLAALYDDFRSFKERLPFQLGAGLYLLYYQPLTGDSTLAGGTADGTLQVFAYYVKAAAEVHGFGANVEVRMRDGGHAGAGASNSYFRGFYSSNLWFQEAYAYYTPGPYLKIKGGKVYRKVGLFWDDSFFGNVQFFDGLKLNPDYGFSVEGEREYAGGRAALSYSAQFFINSDGVNGGLDYQRTLVLPASGMVVPDYYLVRNRSPNPEGELDSGGVPLTTFRNVVDGRLVVSFRPVKTFGLSLGLSALTGTVHRFSRKDQLDDSARMTHFSGDATVTLGPVSLYGEYLRQFGPGVRDADYALGGVHGGLHGFSAHFNVSYVDYHLEPDIEEFIVQPGISYNLGGGLTILLEYNEWQRRDPRLTEGALSLYDRSLNTIIIYTY